MRVEHNNVFEGLWGGDNDELTTINVTKGI